MKSRRYSLKPLITSLFLALGLSPLGGEALADTVDPTTKSVSSSSTATVFTGNVVQNTHYAPQLNLGGFYGTDGDSYGEADLWLPLWQTASQVVYGDVRYQKENANTWDAAIGGGYRWFSDDMERLYDVHGFYNTYNSVYENQFQQLVVGAAVRNIDWRLRADYYYSIGTTQYNVNSLDNVSLKNIGGIQYNGIISYGFENNDMNGGLIELGRTIPYSGGLALYGGYYGFASNNAHPFVNGFSARAEYQLDEALNFKTPFFRHITLESTYQYDNVNQSAFTVGARLDIPLGKSYTNSALQDAMMDYVRFYPHAVQENISSTNPVVFTQNGQAVVFDMVNNANDFNTAMTDNSKVVIVNNDFTTAGSVTLGKNKYITGQNYEYAPGKFVNVTGKSALPTVTGVANNNLFILGINNTVRDMNLVNPVGGYSIIKNVGGSGVGTLTIDNIQGTNGNIYVGVYDNSTDSSISVTNSILNFGDSATGSGFYLGALAFPNSFSSIVDINHFSGNTVNVGAQANNFNAVYFANSATTNITGDVTGNTVTFGAGATNSKAFNFYNIVSNGSAGQQIISGNVSGNTATFGSGASNVSGLYFSNAVNATQKVSGTVSNNTVNFSGSTTSSGIVLTNSGVQTLAGLNGNTVNHLAGDDTGYDISLTNNSGGALTINGLTGNKFNSIYIMNNGSSDNLTININGAGGTAQNGVSAQQAAIESANNNAMTATIVGTGTVVVTD